MRAAIVRPQHCRIQLIMWILGIINLVASVQTTFVNPSEYIMISKLKTTFSVCIVAQQVVALTGRVHYDDGVISKSEMVREKFRIVSYQKLRGKLKRKVYNNSSETRANKYVKSDNLGLRKRRAQDDYLSDLIDTPMDKWTSTQWGIFGVFLFFILAVMCCCCCVCVLPTIFAMCCGHSGGYYNGNGYYGGGSPYYGGGGGSSCLKDLLLCFCCYEMCCVYGDEW